MAQAADAVLRGDLHPKQMQALTSEATELLYGGAAGGGKSHLMRLAAIIWCTEIAGLQVYLFRRIRDDLIKNHMEGPNGFRSLLAGWEACGFCTIVEDEIRFWNGSKIYLCHCKDEKDRFKYQGAEIHVLLIDELTHFTDVIYRFLRNRVRMVGVDVPAKFAGLFPRIVSGANPGGIGHTFVKETFIERADAHKAVRVEKKEGGMVRQYITARLEDNPSMEAYDPGYENRLEGLGSDTLVRAMRWGDWDVVEGAFFDCWDSSKHIVTPFAIPADWTRFRAFDWGSAAPFSVGWWAVAGDDLRGIPRGALVRYREWYGSAGAGKGLKLTTEQVAAGIIERDERESIDYSVADPAIFAEDGGPARSEIFARAGVYFRPADNRRVARNGAMGGWDEMRQRLKGHDGVPMLFSFETCPAFNKQIPALPHDPDRPEDVDTSAEDHAADEGRYACMSRPWVPPKPQPVSTKSGYRSSTQRGGSSWRV